MVHNYKKYENETDEELILRICQDKELIGSWDDVAEVLNELLGYEYTSSKYRKQFQSFTKMLEANKSKFVDGDAQLNEIKVQMRELAKEKQKLSDERVEFNRLIREQARRESYEDLIKRVILEETKPIDICVDYSERKIVISDNDVLCHFTDLHTGVEIENFKNLFNQEVLANRVRQYTEEVIKVKNRHNSENLYIVIGEIVSGIIHNTLRIQNNMDLMEQFKYACDLISAMLIKLSKHFNTVNVYNNLANHSRISPKKEDSLQGENMDILLPFYLTARLQNIDNIYINENKVCNDVAIFNIRGNYVMSSHGDKDSPSSVVQNWTMLFGIKPSLVLLGHRHTNGLSTVFDTKVIETGCVCGTDSYALSIRKANKPEQTISVVDNNGLVCIYDIKLD